MENENTENKTAVAENAITTDNNGTDAENNGTGSKTENVPEKETKPEKTYTEAEVEKIIEKRLRKERATADEKAEQALREVAALKNREACFRAGIKEDCIDDVVTLASKLAGDGDFNKAVAKIAEKYPHFKNTADPNPGKPGTTGTKTKDNIGEISDDALRASFGLAPKNKS